MGVFSSFELFTNNTIYTELNGHCNIERKIVNTKQLYRSYRTTNRAKS